MARGTFITFEGGEGAGKSTQARLLWERLRKLRIDTTLTREPGGTPFAEAIRSVLLDASLTQRSDLSELLLFYVARADHLASHINPALDAGKWVICDRFSDSTRAYQGAGKNLDRSLIELLDHIVVGQSIPDLTIILDVAPEVGLRRSIRRAYGPRKSQSPLFDPEQLVFRFAPDRFESLDLNFHCRVRETFLQIARENSDRCVVVESINGIRHVAQRIWEVVTDRLGASLPVPVVGSDK